MNQDVNENMKLFWNKVSKANGGKVENFSRLKNGKRSLALEEVKVRRILEEYLRISII